MKTDYDADFAELEKGRFQALYLLYGPESLLIREFLAALRLEAVPAGSGDLGYREFDAGETDLGEVLDCARTAAFFGGRRVVVMTGCDFFSPTARRTGDGESGRKGRDTERQESLLLSYLESPSPGTCLVFTSPAGIDRRKKIVKALLEHGRAIICEQPQGSGLTAWVQNRSRRRFGKRLAGEACALLTEMARSSNLAMVDTELAKLSAYTGDREEIGLTDLAAVSAARREVNIFSLMDALGERRPREAVGFLGSLLDTGEPPLRVLWMIGRQIRLIWQAGLLARRGGGPGEVAGRLGVHPFVAKKCLDQSRNFTPAELSRGLELILETDLNIKRGIRAPSLAMELLVLKLTAN